MLSAAISEALAPANDIGYKTVTGKCTSGRCGAAVLFPQLQLAQSQEEQIVL